MLWKPSSLRRGVSFIENLPCCLVLRLVLGDTRLDLLLYDGLGFGHLFPVFHRLNQVGLEQFDETPPVINTGGWRLVTYWARHLVCALPTVGVDESVLNRTPQKVQTGRRPRPQIVGARVLA